MEIIIENIEPNITQEENEENLKRVEEVLQKIARNLLDRAEKEGIENVFPEGCGVRLQQMKR